MRRARTCDPHALVELVSAWVSSWTKELLRLDCLRTTPMLDPVSVLVLLGSKEVEDHRTQRILDQQ